MATVVPAPVGSTGWGTAFADLMEAIADPGKKKREALLAERRSTAITKGAEFEAQLSEASTRLTGYQESVAKSQAASAETNAQIAKLQLEMSEAQKKVMDASPGTASVVYQAQAGQAQANLDKIAAETREANTRSDLNAVMAANYALNQEKKEWNTWSQTDISKAQEAGILDDEGRRIASNNTSRGLPTEMQPSPGKLYDEANPKHWYAFDPARDKHDWPWLQAYQHWLKGGTGPNAATDEYMSKYWAFDMYNAGYVFNPTTLKYEVRPDWKGPPPLMPQGAGTGTKSQAAPKATDQSAWKIPGY